jgi:hypothetical protein
MTRYTRDHQRPRVYFRDLSVPPALRTECWSPPVGYYRVGCLTDTNSEYPNHRLEQVKPKQYMICLNLMCGFSDMDFSVCSKSKDGRLSPRTVVERSILGLFQNTRSDPTKRMKNRCYRTWHLDYGLPAPLCSAFFLRFIT